MIPKSLPPLGGSSWAVLLFALVRLAVGCSGAGCNRTSPAPVPSTSPSSGGPVVISDAAVEGWCQKLVGLGCGHDVPACVSGLGPEIRNGRQKVDLGCLADAGTLQQITNCVGIGDCPP